MEDRITRLEVLCKFYQEELKELKETNAIEIRELKNALKQLSQNMDNLNGIMIRIKWLVSGATAVYVAQEVGILHLIKVVIGAI